ncbi:NADP-dependent oxidoreductase domain - like 1 [Theobroma cacao]|nr:NADP-dependent oxidoreductase domain - like 1 [Theobroma cacao]
MSEEVGYPVPQRAETQGKSEEYLGQWVRKRKISRDLVVIATKVSGPSGQMSWIRDGPKCLDARNITEAVDNSYVPMFGETEYDPVRQFSSVHIEEQLDALGRAVDAGKIRYIGLSNETPYGVMKFLHCAERNAHCPKINSYSLLCRTFDSGMAECCHHERINLLGYSPLAMGILSGKYFASDGGPPDAREILRRGIPIQPDQKHVKSSYDAFVLSHPLVASAVFGVTKPLQLQEVISACNVELTSDIIADINKVHAKFPNPCP